MNGEPLRGSAGVGIDSCTKDQNGWQTCTIIPSTNPNNPVNKDKFIGKMFHLSFTFFLNDSIPTDLYFKEISLVGLKGDFNNDNTVNILDFGFWKTKYLQNQMTLAEFGIWKQQYLLN